MIPTSTRVFLCTEAQDMRRGFDLLAQVVLKVMGGDPRSLLLLECLLPVHGGYAHARRYFFKALGSAPELARHALGA